MIAYEKVKGRAGNLRFVFEDYQPTPDEIIMQGDVLPPIESLHDAAVIFADLKAEKVRELSEACKAAIVGGFTSTALGAPHRYDSDLEAQVNLIGAAALPGPVEYTCTDGAGVKAVRAHTVAQIKQVLTDGAALKIDYLAHFRALKNATLAATDAAELALIEW